MSAHYQRLKRPFMKMAICPVIFIIVFAIPVIHLNAQSVFYDFDVMAQTGGTGEFTTIRDAVSINDDGRVAFVALEIVELEEGVYVSQGPGVTERVSFEPSLLPPFRDYGNTVSINNNNPAEVASVDNVAASVTLAQARVWEDNGNPANPEFFLFDNADTINDFFLSEVDINDNGNMVYIERDVSFDTNILKKSVDRGDPLADPPIPPAILEIGSFPTVFSDPVIGNQPIELKPQLSNLEEVVFRSASGKSVLKTDPGKATPYGRIAGIPEGFNRVVSGTTLVTPGVGASPGISDDGDIVVFFGNETTDNDGDGVLGPGIFASIFTGTSLADREARKPNSSAFLNREIVRVAGFEGELGVSDAGFPLQLAFPEPDSKVSVIHQRLGAEGLEDDSIVIAFIGDPSGATNIFSDQLGLWTLRLDILSQSGNDLLYNVASPLPVIQINDSIDGQSVESISIYDPISSDSASQPTRGGHWIACVVDTAGGGQKVLRAGQFDTDGDGLLDHWEEQGIDMDLDGMVDLDLPAMGADPMRKDLFVEVDVMDGVTFLGEARNQLISAFDDAPVDNPPPVNNGITLHLMVDDGDTIPFLQSWDDDFIAFGAAKMSYLGTSDERASGNWEHIKAARQRVFRYCAVVNKIDNAVGWAEKPGNDFYVAFGGIYNGDAFGQASTFMHELGHNLNLGHGGNDEANFKPNYVSVMNYGFDFYVDDIGNKLPIDYSREATVSLDEANLDEMAGIQSVKYSNVLTFHGYQPPGQGPQIAWVQLNSTPYDWNRDGVIDASVNTDLNWLGAEYGGGADTASPGETLEAYNDWELIVLPLGTSGVYADGQHIPPQHEGITEEEIIFMRENLPPPPINVLLGDVNQDGVVNLLDVDFFIDRLASGTYQAEADCNEDGVINLLDIDPFIAILGGG